MATRYSVLQYLPDPSTDERINFGVVVFGGDHLRSRFVRNWGRIRAFGGPDTTFLRDFVREIESVVDNQSRLPGFRIPDVDAAAVFERAHRWKNSIQFTEPRASTLPVDQLLDEVAKRFLRERIPRPRVRDRRAAASATARAFDVALRAQGARRPEKYIARNEELEGKHDLHQFDVALVNGAAHLGALAMSFAGGDAHELKREIRANAWTIDDLHQAAPDFPIAVVTIPPPRNSKTYAHAVSLFADLGAEVVPEEDAPEWATEATAAVYRELVGAAR